MELNVLPKIADRPRVIVMDHLSAHLTPELSDLIKRNGHNLVLRPIHSPDFGAIEWLFHQVHTFMDKNELGDG